MVEPVSVGALVAGALSEGAAILAKGLLSETAKDAYSKLRQAVTKWVGHDVKRLEEDPSSTGRGTVVAELVDKCGDSEKEELTSLAHALIAELGEAGRLDAEARITVIATHGGMAAGRDQSIVFAVPSAPDQVKGS